ncbi:MAG: RidA family protein [Chloroflexi bacterium]|nr:RidA family protein [Chloroflexota bacterium]
MPKKAINPDGLFKANFYSQGVRAGNTVFIAGQVGAVAAGTVAGGGNDFKAEAKQAMENIRKVVETAGGKMSDVVRLTCFMTDMGLGKDLYPAIEAAFPGVKPAVTAIVVKSLGSLTYKVEIEGTAVIE